MAQEPLEPGGMVRGQAHECQGPGHQDRQGVPVHTGATTRMGAAVAARQAISEEVDILGRAVQDAGDGEAGRDDPQPLRRHHGEHTFEGDARLSRRLE